MNPIDQAINTIKKYQNPAGPLELDPAAISDTFTGKGKIRSLRRDLRQARRDNKQLMRDIESYDYITDQSVLDDFVNRIENVKSPKMIRQKIRAAKDEYRSRNFLGIGDGTGNALPSQLYRYWSRHFGYQKHHNKDFMMSGEGTDVIDLGKNVIRLTPDSKQQTALFNEFVEDQYPSVHPAKKYQSGEISTFGDDYHIPTKNISVYAGVEDGKFKTDSLHNFNPNTTIYPARNVKRNLSKIYGIDVEHKSKPDNWYDAFSLYNALDTKTPGDIIEAQNLAIKHRSYNPEAHEQYVELAKNFKTNPLYSSLEKKHRRKYKKAINRFLKNKPLSNGYVWMIGDLGWVESDYKEADDSAIRNAMWNYTTDSDKQYNYIDENGNIHPISNYNVNVSDNKLIFGNPNGGLFIGDFKNISKPQLDSLNSWLRRNPSWLVQPDLGSFSRYRLDNPTLDDYLKQYFGSSSYNNSNVYTVGTTKDNKMWE